MAILFVMAFHTFPHVARGGFIGVDIFFVLSGFLITTLLLEERDRIGRISLRLFYARRALRLFPALLAFCVACLAWAVIFRDNANSDNTFVGVPSALFYVSNVVRAFGQKLGLLGHTWSLSVEEQFYILWPLTLIGLLAIVGRRVILALSVSGVAAILLFRLIVLDGGGNSALIDKLYFLTHADGLLIGCALALAVSVGYVARFPGHLARKGAVLGGLVLVAVVLLVPDWRSAVLYEGGFTVVAVATARLSWAWSTTRFPPWSRCCLGPVWWESGGSPTACISGTRQSASCSAITPRYP